jgi:hypothetical protein
MQRNHLAALHDLPEILAKLKGFSRRMGDSRKSQHNQYTVFQ